MNKYEIKVTVRDDGQYLADFTMYEEIIAVHYLCLKETEKGAIIGAINKAFKDE